MKRFAEFAAAVVLVVIFSPACENFKNVTAEVPIDTQDKIKFGFDIGAMIKEKNPTLSYTDPITGQTVSGTLTELLVANGNKLPAGIKKTIDIDLPDMPAPTEVTNNPDIEPYKKKIYNVRIDTIEYVFNKNTLPSQVSLDRSLLLIMSSDGADAVGVALLPPISGGTKQGETAEAEFAPGGQDAASDLLASLDFKVGLVLADGTGNYKQNKISVTIDSDKDPNVPGGALELVIRLKLVFRVAPLA